MSDDIPNTCSYKNVVDRYTLEPSYIASYIAILAISYAVAVS